MTNPLIILPLSIWAFVFAIYILYLHVVLKTSKKEEYLEIISKILRESLNPQDLPNVTILVPAYNEETVIFRKLQDINDLNYPCEKIKVIVIDDCSTDRTRKMAEVAFKKLKLQGRVLVNERRMGLSACYNKGIAEAKDDYVLLTDADVLLDSNSLRIGVKVLKYLKDVQAVTGRTGILSDTNTAAVKIERTYRNFWDLSSTAESAIHSTFPGGCGFALLKRASFSNISDCRGSSDGNISLSVVKKGFRYIYVPQIVFYETVSQKLGEQIRQKARRAATLIQSSLMNTDILFNQKYGEFGKTIFPLRFVILTISPSLIFVGLSLTLLVILDFSKVLFLFSICTACLFLLLGTKTNIPVFVTPTSFLIHQFYLLLGLILSHKKTGIWRKIERRPEIYRNLAKHSGENETKASHASKNDDCGVAY